METRRTVSTDPSTQPRKESTHLSRSEIYRYEIDRKSKRPKARARNKARGEFLGILIPKTCG